MTEDKIAELARAEQRRQADLTAEGASKAEVDSIMRQGWVYDSMAAVDAIAAFRRERAQRQEERRRGFRVRLTKAGVPERHLLSVFDREPERSEAVDIIDAWLDSGETFCVLLGGVGVGKSAAAAWAVIEEAKQPEGYAECRDLTDEYTSQGPRAEPRRARGGEPGKFIAAADLTRVTGFDSTKEWGALASAHLLVLDDVGAEYVDGKGWSTSALHKLVCERYDACLRTVITSNLTADAFKKQYGERVADRIRESGRVVSLGGKSRRSR